MSSTSIYYTPPVQAHETLEEALPLAAAQRRLWFVQGLDQESSAYTIPFVFDLSGPVDAAVLKSSLRHVVARHESLRTVFDEVEGEPMQIFRQEPELVFETEDLSRLDQSDRKASVRSAILRECRRTFDLKRGPLLVSRLLRLGRKGHGEGAAEDRFVWLLTVHHIVFDGASLPVLISELGEIYQATVEGRSPELAELPLQYADFTAWLDEEVEHRIEDDLAFWRAELDGYPSILRLPTDRPRPRRQTFGGDALRAPLSAETILRVRELGRSAGATEFMTYLALWQAFLSRLTGEDRLLVGVPVAGRERPESEGLIGNLVNSLMLRADLTDDPSVRELVSRTRSVCLRAFAHQEIPFDRLVEGLKPERHSSFSPLAQIAFTMDSFSDLPSELAPGLSLSCREFELKSSKVDLTLMVRTTGDGPNLVLEYNTDLFDAATAERWLSGFARLLDRALADPGARISELPMLGEGERALVCGEWAEVVRSYPRDAGLDELFARQVAASPDAVALCAGVAGSDQVTFSELDRRAAKVARLLSTAGVGRGDRVALLLDRSAELVAAALGIVRVGGAYVPLDPGYPEERLRYMLEDSGSRVVVTGAATVRSLPALARLTVVPVGAGTEAAPGGTDDLVPAAGIAGAPIGGDDLAYVIYTSGSTGRPKGVEVPQRGVVRLVLENDHTDTGPETTILHMSSVSFDAAVMEMWGPLLTGGRMVVHPPGPAAPDELAETLARQRVTSLFLTTALFNQVVEQVPAAFLGLSQLNTGGEKASPEHFARALEAAPRLRLRNLYGPTENTAYSTHHPVLQAPDGDKAVPIGRPIANSSAYVVDARLGPVPIGVVGELLVGGDGLARGYAGRPALSAERFVPDPFGGRSSENRGGGRLYRTGDLVRWLADGTLEFVGRNDGQVKVRGFRIEPGEIERALAGHPRVAEALVTVWDARGRQDLVAYLVPVAGDDGAGLDAGELRGHLLRHLPEFMVPQAFMLLDRFPLTANGKVDRQALPAPERHLGSGRGECVEPRTPLEQEIAGIWEDVLGVKGVGVRDDFFELGGHSLLATRVLARIHEDFGIRLPLQTVFEGPTVEDLTRVMGEQLLAGVSVSEPVA